MTTNELSEVIAKAIAAERERCAKAAVAYMKSVGNSDILARGVADAIGCDDGKPARTRECDCCGQMKPDVTAVHIAYVGDTSACADCRNPV